MSGRITLKTLKTSIDDLTVTVGGTVAKLDSLATKVNVLVITVDDLATTIDDLARMTADGFRHQGEEFRAEISRLDVKIDYRFDTLSNRMDDLALNKVSRQEHVTLARRVSDIEGSL